MSYKKRIIRVLSKTDGMVKITKEGSFNSYFFSHSASETASLSAISRNFSEKSRTHKRMRLNVLIRHDLQFLTEN